MADQPDPDPAPAPAWVPRYLHDARAGASAALESARHVGEDLAGEVAIAAAVRELAGELRALRHQLSGGRAPRAGGIAGMLIDALDDVARRGWRGR